MRRTANVTACLLYRVYQLAYNNFSRWNYKGAHKRNKYRHGLIDKIKYKHI